MKALGITNLRVLGGSELSPLHNSLDPVFTTAPGTPTTTCTDRIYAMIYSAVEDAIDDDTPVAGSYFWAGGGAGRAEHDDCRIRRGETAFVGDPPHQPPGWYSVFNIDQTARALIRRHAKNIGMRTEPG